MISNKIHRKISCRNNLPFRRNIFEWNNVKYYIPLCPRPTIPVTIELLNSVEPLDTDKPIIQKYKERLHQNVSEHLGFDIIQSSSHMYNGMITRAAIYSGGICYFIPDFVILMCVLPGFLVYYLWFSIMIIDDSLLHKRIVNITKE